MEDGDCLLKLALAETECWALGTGVYLEEEAEVEGGPGKELS